MAELRFALLGAGFWAQFQLAGWRELGGARCVAIFNRNRARAAALAERFDVPAVYEDLDELLAHESLDFIDIVAGEEAHADFTRRAAARGLPVICQKPLGRTAAEAEAMLAACRAAGVPLLVHENWRFQSGLRALGRHLHRGTIGPVFRARLDMRSGFPVFDNQPYLATLERFILTDLGTHVLDTARWLFGEPRALHCLTRRVHPHIRGEDVSTVTLDVDGAAVQVNLAYAGSVYEVDHFPETFAFVEGARGTLELGPGGVVRETTAAGTSVHSYPPAAYPWADPRYAMVHASIVPCLAQLLDHLRGGAPAETTAEDNLRTLRLVEAAYRSAASGQVEALPRA